jgi:hypothetical protein
MYTSLYTIVQKSEQLYKNVLESEQFSCENAYICVGTVLATSRV